MTFAPALRGRDLYRFYHAGDEETLALRGVSIEVEAGEVVAVAGPSGSGKSTMLACLAGLDDPDGGTVHVAGERISRRPESVRARLRARRIGMLYQSDNMVVHLTVRDNVALAARLGSGRGPGPERLLDRLGLGARASAVPATLSGGELARASLAVALAAGPSVLLADEPTGELDSHTEGEVLRLLRAEAERGCAVLLVSHSPAVAAVADRVVRLRDGRVER